MNILLIDCPENLKHARLPLSWGHESLNISYIATLIKENNNVKLLDFNIEKYSKNKTLSFCMNFQPRIKRKIQFILNVFKSFMIQSLNF